MQPARLRPNFFRHGCGKGNHVMFYFSLNFVNALQVKVAAFGYGTRGIFRDNPGIGKGQAGGSFHAEPATEFIVITPDSAHFRARITGDQRLSFKKRPLIINSDTLVSPTAALVPKSPGQKHPVVSRKS